MRWLFLCLLPLMLLYAPGTLGIAVADDLEKPYALVALRNDTGRTITYTAAWGDNDGKEITLRPGAWYWHSWKYDPNSPGRSPVFSVQFAAPRPVRLRDGGVQWTTELKSYDLQKNQAPAKEYRYARLYYFADRSNGQLDLIDPRK